VATGERGSSRNSLQAHLRARGFETLVHYPVALNDQPAFARYRRKECPVAAAAAQELLSLPLHPRVRPDQVDEITAVIADWRS
jgi:dTDP-4-amino-4,6-dideoxygalactose transaminase